MKSRQGLRDKRPPFGSDLLNDLQRHHGMNLPNGILGQPLSAV